MRFWVAAFATALMLLGTPPGGRSLHAADRQRLEIVTGQGVRNFSVEMAVTPDQLNRGLMYRRELAEGRGMLFDFKSEQPISMWMKNTYIPLDMLFIRKDGTIVRIAENTEPHSTKMISSGPPVRAVLEVAGGSARKFGISEGDKVVHPIFRGR